jgi:hypothetical protein
MPYLFGAGVLAAAAIVALMRGFESGHANLPLIVLSVAGSVFGLALHLFFKRRESSGDRQ